MELDISTNFAREQVPIDMNKVINLRCQWSNTPKNWVPVQNHNLRVDPGTAISCLGYSGVTEDREIFMSMNGLQSSCLARGTRVLEVRKCLFMSGR